jgi:hypothetical protein
MSERLMRKMLSTVLPHPKLFRMALMAAKSLSGMIIAGVEASQCGAS